MKAFGDVDIGLLDTSDRSRYQEGQAVVGWCNTGEDKHCNIGVISSSDFR